MLGIGLKTESDRYSRMQQYALISGALLTFGPQFYGAIGLTAENAIVIMAFLTAADKYITMYLRSITTEPMR